MTGDLITENAFEIMLGEIQHGGFPGEMRRVLCDRGDFYDETWPSLAVTEHHQRPSPRSATFQSRQTNRAKLLSCPPFRILGKEPCAQVRDRGNAHGLGASRVLGGGFPFGYGLYGDASTIGSDVTIQSFMSTIVLGR